MSDKQNLRIWAKEERKKLNISALSKLLAEKIQNNKEYQQSKNIMIYYPKKEEINLLDLIEDKTKIFYLPRIDGSELLCCPYKKNDKLCESCFKTLEPLSKPIEKSLIDLVIIPALAVDKNNYRLGYGGGFYDRFLKNINAKKFVCIPKDLIVETVFPCSHDIAIDTVISV